MTLPTGRGLLAVLVLLALALAYHLLDREVGTPDVGPSPPGPRTQPDDPTPAEREEGEPGYGREMPREADAAEETTRQDDPQGAISPREGISAHPPARDAHERGALAGEAAEPAEAGR